MTGAARRRVVLGVTDPMSVAFLHPLIEELADDDVHVVCGAARTDGLDRAEDAARRPNVTVHRIDWQRGIDARGDARGLLEVTRLLRTLRPDVVHAATPKAGLLLMLGAWLTRVRVRVYACWGLRGSTTTGMTGALLGLSERVTAMAATVVTANSRSLAREHHALVGGRRRAVVVGAGSSHGVDAERFGPSSTNREAARGLRRDLGIPADAGVVLFVGRLHPDKGVEDLISVTATLPAEAHVVLVGPMELPPADVQRLQALASDGRVHVAGATADTAPWFSLGDVLVLPSRREGFPNVVLEAACAGVPTIGYAATGTVDAVVDGVTGWLVPVGDVDELAATIVKALKDPVETRRRGQAAQHRATTLFSPQAVARATLRLYDHAPTPIVLTGQPAWARRLAVTLSSVADPDVLVLTRPADLLRIPRDAAWLWIGFRPGARTLRGRAFDLASILLRWLWRPRVWAHWWIGTDVQNAARELRGHGRRPGRANALHLAAAPWLVSALADLDVTATFVPFPVALPPDDGPAIADRDRVVLTYIPDARPWFYGAAAVLELATALPDVRFRVMGGGGGWADDPPPNVTFLGWVDPTDEYRRARVLLRLVEHDAMGGTVREALAAGLHVVYTHPHEGCELAPWPVDAEALQDAVTTALRAERPNEDGARYVRTQLSPEVIVPQLLEALDAGA